jgi:hypothetical protein
VSNVEALIAGKEKEILELIKLCELGFENITFIY